MAKYTIRGDVYSPKIYQGPTDANGDSWKLSGTYTWSKGSGRVTIDPNGSTDYSVSLPFVGTSIEWYAPRASNLGIANVYIDGVLQTTVDMYSSSSESTQLRYSKTGLSYGPHTIKISHSGTSNPSTNVGGTPSKGYLAHEYFTVTTNSAFPGFYFNGHHSSEYGVYVTNSDRQILPKWNNQYQEVPGRDGAHDFGGVYEDRVITINCQFLAANQSDWNLKQRQIAKWLWTGWGPGTEMELMFDDEPNIVYKGKFVGRVPLTKFSRMATFSLVFRAQPILRSKEKWTISGNSPVSDKKFIYSGTSKGLPKLTLTNTGGVNIKSITAQLSWHGEGAVGQNYAILLFDTTDTTKQIAPGQSIIFDSDGYSITRSDGLNLLPYANGAEFPFLFNGLNMANISASNAAGNPVSFNYKIEFNSYWI